MEATIRDVARRAAVSVASASRALNGLNNVRPETRDRVLKAADELGYVPHAGARSLSLSRANAIGVVLPDFHGEFFSEIVRGMDGEASRRGYLLLLSSMHEGGEQARIALRAMRGRVDGLIVMAPHIDAATLEGALPPRLPTLLVNGPTALIGRPGVRMDNARGVDAVVRHLAAAGRRRIIHIAGPEGNVDAQERADAYRASLATHAPGVEPVVLAGNFGEEAGAEAARAILDRGLVCDAVFAANDMMAIGCFQELRGAGVRVPEAIAVAGFDDVPLARHLGLTTVSARIVDLGALAVRRLIDALEGKKPDVETELHAPELVVRASTGTGS